MKYSMDVIGRWLDALESPKRGLTNWEAEFVASIAERVEDGKSLSERQEEILEKIYAEKT